MGPPTPSASVLRTHTLSRHVRDRSGILGQTRLERQCDHGILYRTSVLEASITIGRVCGSVCRFGQFGVLSTKIRLLSTNWLYHCVGRRLSMWLFSMSCSTEADTSLPEFVAVIEYDHSPIQLRGHRSGLRPHGIQSRRCHQTTRRRQMSVVVFERIWAGHLRRGIVQENNQHCYRNS